MKLNNGNKQFLKIDRPFNPKFLEKKSKISEPLHVCHNSLPRKYSSLVVQPGAYLGGGHLAMAPPLGRQDSIISIE